MYSKTFFRRIMILSLLPILIIGCSASNDNTVPQVRDAATVLSDAVAAMGVADLNAVVYAGTAWQARNGFRQTPQASPPWNYRDEITDYQRAIDFKNPTSRATGDTFAQNIFHAPPVVGTYEQNIKADQTAWAQQLEIWLTPWGFLAGAQAHDVEMGSKTLYGEDYTTLTWKSSPDQVSPSGLQYTVTGYINEHNLVSRVETWVEDAFMGDLHIEGVYRDYVSINGLMVPTVMEQRRGEGGVFGVTVASAEKNPSNLSELLTFPEGGPRRGFFPPGGQDSAELTQKLDDGVYLITGGYVAMAVEFADYVAVFEAGQSEQRGEQILAEVKKAIPGKPIRYVINSHPHSDHTAGLVPFVREGATIITHEDNVDYLKMGLSTPRTLLGEETLNPKFEGAGSVYVLEDDTMRFEFHHIYNAHSYGMLVGYLPKQKILFQADFTLPQPGAQANPFVVTLANYVDQNNLDFDRYFAVHAAREPQTRAQLMNAIGK